MISNRRTYFMHPAKFDAGIELLQEFRALTIQVTGRNLRMMTCIHGPMHVITLDARFHNDQDEEKFFTPWYSKLYEINFAERWFQNVKQMTIEKWVLTDFDNDAVEGYWGNITHRLIFQPYSNLYNNARAAAKQIKEETMNVFQKELIVSNCIMGASNTLTFEMDFGDMDQQTSFIDEWMKCIKEKKLYETFLENVQGGYSEIWKTLD